MSLQDYKLDAGHMLWYSFRTFRETEKWKCGQFVHITRLVYGFAICMDII